ncbi:MAG: flagellar hook-associated protein FlgK [Selenomonadaceae bacterium]|nr:flagellar hook-associated protein FlgK [Selenomonadaceae bacterium]
MRSTFTGLNTMVRGIFANQLSLDTVGHNITNASTEGYSRQSVNLAATMCQMQPSIYGELAVGTGVDSTSILRARDVFADKQYRMEVATQEYNAQMQKNYDRIEVTFNDTTETDDGKNVGIQYAMQQFWESLKTLSTNASDNACRKNVINQGTLLSNKIISAKDDLVDQINALYEELDIRINNVNELTSKIVHLNKQIVAMEAGGSVANDLRDQRDLVCDQLAEYIDISVSERSEGYYSVVSNGITLVNAADKLTLEYTRGGRQGAIIDDVNYGVQDYSVNIKETGTIFKIKNGSMKGLIDAIDENKSAISDLANISALMLTTFNAQHAAGYDLNGNQGGNFFGASGITYSSYNYSEYRYTSTSKDANYFYVFNGNDILTGVDIIEELKVNPLLTADDGAQYIAAKNNDNETGTDASATAQGNNAVLLSDFFDMTKAYTEETGNVKDLYYYYYDNNHKTIDVYDDRITYTTTYSSSTMTVTERQVLYRGMDGVVYRDVVTTNDLDDYGNTTNTTVSSPVFVDEKGNELNIWTDNNGAIVGFRSASDTSIKYQYEDNKGILIYSANDGTIYKSVDANGEIVYTDGNGTVLDQRVESTSADGVFSITYSDSQGNASYTVNRSKDSVRALGDISIYAYYNYAMAQLGLRSESMDLKVESQDELMVQIKNWRSSMSGVDWNEELTNMIKFQKGYGACARCLTAMDEMLDRLVNNTGQVGR